MQRILSMRNERFPGRPIPSKTRHWTDVIIAQMKKTSVLNRSDRIKKGWVIHKHWKNTNYNLPSSQEYQWLMFATTVQ